MRASHYYFAIRIFFRLLTFIGLHNIKAIVDRFIIIVINVIHNNNFIMLIYYRSHSVHRFALFCLFCPISSMLFDSVLSFYRIL